MHEHLMNRFLELERLCFERNAPTHSAFLSPEGQEVFLRMKRAYPEIRADLCGGYEDAERRVAVFVPEYMESPSDASPVVWICIAPLQERFAEMLTHRDVLGAVMNLGIERDRTGDILFDGSTAWIAVMDDLAEVLCDQLNSVRHTSVICSRKPLPEGLARPKLVEKTATVASVRLDAVLSSAFPMSRSDAADLIRERSVRVDGRTVESGSVSLRPGNVISVYRRGRFVYLGEEGVSKKGRTVIRIGLYV